MGMLRGGLRSWDICKGTGFTSGWQGADCRGKSEGAGSELHSLSAECLSVMCQASGYGLADEIAKAFGIHFQRLLTAILSLFQ